MKLLLLKTLLQRRARDEGFTLPMVIALGLVMILLGAINITRANEENLTAISQNSRSDAQAIAELGIARYREMLDNNRILSVYNSDQWTSQSGEACDTINDTAAGNWADTASATWRPINLSEVTLDTDLNNNGNKTDTSVTVGEYKLVSYEYDNDGTLGDGDDNGIFDQNAGNNSSFGYLKVKGRTANGAEGEAQVEVKIPIRSNANELSSLQPVLWIESNPISALGSGNFTVTGGNVVLQSCSDPTALGTSTTVGDPRNLPGIPAEPASDVSDLVNINDSTFASLSSALRLPRFTGDVKRPDNKFYYTTTTIDLDDGESVRLNGLANNVIRVTGAGSAISLDGNVNINAGTAKEPGTTSGNLEIYAPNATAIDITGAGIKNIQALIHAPKATVNITGTGAVNITGAMWVKDWKNPANANVTITGDSTKVIDQTPGNVGNLVTRNSYKVYSAIDERSAKPVTYTPDSWKTEKVQ